MRHLCTRILDCTIIHSLIKWVNHLLVLKPLAHILAVSRTERHQWDIPLAWYDATYFKVNLAMAY